MLIRAGTASDLDTISSLHAASWRAAYRGIMRDTFLDGPLVENRRAEWAQKFRAANVAAWGIFLAFEDDEPMGFACAIPVRNARWGAFLDNLHLHPAARGRGLGARLMAEVATWALQRGDTGLHLLVYEPNAPARRFYARQGGEEVERIAVTSPDGNVIPEVRVAWSSLQSLQDERGARSEKREARWSC